MFCIITLVLATLDEDERLVHTPLNTTDNVGEKFGDVKIVSS